MDAVVEGAPRQTRIVKHRKTEAELKAKALERLRRWRAKQRGPDWVPQKPGRKPMYATEEERQAAKKVYAHNYYLRRKQELINKPTPTPQFL